MDNTWDERVAQQRSSRPSIPDTEFYHRQQQESQNKKIQEMRLSIEKLMLERHSVDADIVYWMDFIERVVYTCGGESKVTFLDVGNDFIKIETRVPLNANLYQFLAESPENPRFHKVVTKILLKSERIKNVRWLPRERGALMLVTFNE